jgi:hypothetical protein
MRKDALLAAVTCALAVLWIATVPGRSGAG